MFTRHPWSVLNGLISGARAISYGPNVPYEPKTANRKKTRVA